jgi:hypothetical protein
MAKIAFLLAPLAVVLVGLLPAVPAQAQANRTFVSAAGNDSNNCATVSTPCRHLANAYAATAANGEIDVLDPANYGELTITGPVSIEGHGWASISATANGGTAILINAQPGDKINIIGVVLDGIALPNTGGISVIGGGSLYVQDSIIRNFTAGGINFSPNVPGSSQGEISLSNTLIADNGLAGINIEPSGSGAVVGVLDHVNIKSNVNDGLDVFSETQTINVTVTDSVSANNGGNGIISETIGTTVNVMVRNSTIANNGRNGLSNGGVNDSGLFAAGSGAQLWVTRSTITGNLVGWSTLNSGLVTSFGDNNIVGNGSANTEPPSPLTYK